MRERDEKGGKDRKQYGWDKVQHHYTGLPIGAVFGKMSGQRHFSDLPESGSDPGAWWGQRCFGQDLWRLCTAGRKDCGDSQGKGGCLIGKKFRAGYGHRRVCHIRRFRWLDGSGFLRGNEEGHLRIRQGGYP